MRLSTICTLLIAALFVAPTLAEEKEEGFTPIFDGKTLAGWQGSLKGYTVDDGAIQCVAKGGGNLYTEKEYGDFHLKFSFKLTPGANNGLGIRAPMGGDPAYVGMELQVLDDDAEQYKNLAKYQYHGSIYGVVAAKRGHQKKVGEWNEQEVIAKGNQIKVILNGETIVDADIAKASDPKTVDGKDHPGLKREKGYIVFCGHGSDVWFKNLRIKELKQPMSGDSTEVFAITGRRRFDPMSISRREDFRTRQLEAGDPFATGSWTPYCVDAKTGRVALVDCPANVDLTAAPFFYQAQYQHAQRLALVSYEQCIALAEAPDSRLSRSACNFIGSFNPEPTATAWISRITSICSSRRRRWLRVKRTLTATIPSRCPQGDVLSRSERRLSFQTPVMIYSTGRAGTTLVSKMFARLPSCVSLSEPDLHTSLQAQGLAQEIAVQLLRTGAQLYFGPKEHQPATHLVLKFRGMCIELAAPIRAALPGVKDFFLYRDAEAYVTSSMRAFSYTGSALWGLRLLHKLVVTRPILAHVLAMNRPIMERFFPLTADYTSRELARLGPVGLIALSWLSMMHRALETSKQAPLPSLRYENLMRDPPLALSRVLALCDLPPGDVSTALTALGEDSQHGSVVGRERAGKFELSTRDRATIRAVLARHPLIDRPDFELPHPIA